jgi:hypothetical protein
MSGVGSNPVFRVPTLHVGSAAKSGIPIGIVRRRKVPLPDSCTAANDGSVNPLLNRLVGAREERGRDGLFVDGQVIRDRARLADGLDESSTIYVFQALSGG